MQLNPKQVDADRHVDKEIEDTEADRVRVRPLRGERTRVTAVCAVRQWVYATAVLECRRPFERHGKVVGETRSEWVAAQPVEE